MFFDIDFNIAFSVMPGAVLYLFYSAVAQIFYETLMSSVFLHSYALRAVNQNVLANLLSAIDHIVSGRNFPIEALPKQLRYFTWIFPQAQGIIGARRLFALDFPAFWARFLAVTAQFIVYGALGIWLVKKGIAKVRSEGLVQVPPA